MAVVVVPLIDARTHLHAQCGTWRRARTQPHAQGRNWRRDRLREDAAQRLVATRQDRPRDCSAGPGRRTAGGVEVDLVEIALHVAIVAAETERLEAHQSTARPHRRRAPIMARHIRDDAAVLGGAPAGPNRRRTLVLVLLADPCAKAQQARRIAAEVESEIDVALVAGLIGERRPGV